ncbi:MAG: hypothetical protein MUC29_07445 [Pyrinomonadaceae bacterium]|nr:hypothetical protein [Pyrinomonadaceae bacterium]
MTRKILFLLSFALFSVQIFSASYMTEPSFSPDRKEIVFVSGGDIWSGPSAGGTAQLLVSHAANESRPMFSPDGKRLAFGSNRTGNGDIYVLNLETNDLSRITFDDANDSLDAWSRDGNWLYFTSNSKDIAGMNDIFRVSSNGGTPQQVSSDRYANEFWSTPLNDGSIVFSSRGLSNSQWWRHGRSHIDETEIWSKTGENYQQIANRGAKQLWIMSTADGAKTFYVSDRNGTENLYSQAKSGQAKPLTNFANGRVLWANLSYDGKEIVFERNFGLWKISADGGKATEIPITLRGFATSPSNERINLSGQIREFSLSPDGKKVAMISRGEVFAALAEEENDAVRVTNTFAAESFPAWSGDSKKLVYSSERNGTMELFQYDFTSETETQITKGFNDYSPIFSPDGKTLAFIRNGRALMSYDVSTKQEKELCKIFTDSPPLIGGRTFAWSPDGKWLAYLGYSPETRSYTNAYAVPSSGGKPNALSSLGNSNAGSISWSPDGSYILFDTSQRTEDGTIARIELKLKTPKFKEDAFRDLFKQENPKEKPTAPNPTPTTSPTPKVEAKPEEKKDEKPSTEIVFEEIRQRLSMLRPGVNVNEQVISPDGKTLLILASAEGQFNLYSVSLDELASPKFCQC